MKINLLILPVLLAGLVFAYIEPASAAQKVNTKTISLWCNVGHGGDTAVKLGPDTWSRFNYLATNALNGMAATKFAEMGAPEVNWKLNAAMGGAGSKAEDVLASWLQGIISSGSSNAISFTKLPDNVDAIRAIAVKLRVAVKNDPQMFDNNAANIQSTKKALAQFADFEKAYAQLTPSLANSCHG